MRAPKQTFDAFGDDIERVWFWKERIDNGSGRGNDLARRDHNLQTGVRLMETLSQDQAIHGTRQLHIGEEQPDRSLGLQESDRFRGILRFDDDKAPPTQFVRNHKANKHFVFDNQDSAAPQGFRLALPGEVGP
jgi:hypothetical protein